MAKNDNPLADLFRGISEQFYQGGIAELEQEKMAIKNDATLSEKQKNKKLAEIDDKIGELHAQNSGFHLAHTTLKHLRR